MNTNLIDHVQQVHHKNMTPSSLQSNMDISIERLLMVANGTWHKCCFADPYNLFFNSCEFV